MLTNTRNSGSRKSTPGNICVESTMPENAPRPRKVKREMAYDAKIAISTLNTVAELVTIRLFTKYCASGTVDQMSTNGVSVRCDGHHSNAPCTSRSGLMAEVTITYSGATVKIT